jgi:hypothetical protein
VALTDVISSPCTAQAPGPRRSKTSFLSRDSVLAVTRPGLRRVARACLASLAGQKAKRAERVAWESGVQTQRKLTPFSRANVHRGGPVEGSAQPGDTGRGEIRGVLIHPPLAGHPLAVRFVMPVLRPDACRGQGDHLCASWAHEHWGNGALIGEGWARCGVTLETVVAMQGVGGKVLRPIPGQQELL